MSVSINFNEGTECSHKTALTRLPILVTQRFPAELWDEIYNAATAAERETAAVGSPPWMCGRSALKRLMRVNRIWWFLAVKDIYSQIYLNRIGQLPAIVQSLEVREGREVRAKLYRDSVERIIIDLYLPEAGWESVYCDTLPVLLKRCPRLTSLDIRSIKLLAPSSQCPFGRTCPLLAQGLFFNLSRIHGNHGLPKLTHLALGEPYLIPPRVSSLILSTYGQLVSLVVALQNDSSMLRAKPLIVLPNLLKLTLIIKPSERRAIRPGIIADNWRMPRLSFLSIVAGGKDALHRTATMYFPDIDVIALCRKHGDTLEHIYIEHDAGDGVYFDCKKFVEIFCACTHLRSIAVPCFIKDLQAIPSDSGEDIKLRHQSLQSLTVFLSKIPNSRPQDNTPSSLIYRFNQTMEFPMLSFLYIIRTCSRMPKMSRGPRLSRVRRWFEAFESKGRVHFEVHKNDRVLLRNSNRYDDDNDDDDSDFVPASESESNFSDSFIDSDPGEDSGLENPSSLDHDLKPQKEVGFWRRLKRWLVPERLSKADALERFEESIR